MNKKKMIIVGIIVFLVAIFGLYGTKKNGNKNGGKQNQGPSYLILKPGPLRVIVESTGKVIPFQELDIKCKASGEITEIPFDISDEVGQGDLLVQLDPQDEERSLKKAENSLLVSQTKLTQAKISLEIAERALENERVKSQAALEYTEARVKEVQTKFERQGALLDKKMISREEYESAETSLFQVKSDIVTARARVADLKSQELTLQTKKQDIKIAEAQVESDTLALSDAQQRLKDTTILSPIDGIIASRSVQPGQIIASAINNVSGGTSMMVLIDMSRIFVHASVEESEIGNVQVGQRVKIMVDAFPEEVFSGVVSRIAARGVESSNVVTFEVRIEITSKNMRLLRPQMTAAVEIIICDEKEILTVPSTGVNRDRQGSFVMVEKDGKSQKKYFQTGVTDGDTVQVLSGLSEGDKIIIPEATTGRWDRPNNSQRGGGGMMMGMPMGMPGGGRR